MFGQNCKLAVRVRNVACFVEHLHGQRFNLTVKNVQGGARQAVVVAYVLPYKPANHAFRDQIAMILSLEIFDVPHGLKSPLKHQTHRKAHATCVPGLNLTGFLFLMPGSALALSALVSTALATSARRILIILWTISGVDRRKGEGGANGQYKWSVYLEIEALSPIQRGTARCLHGYRIKACCYARFRFYI